MAAKTNALLGDKTGCVFALCLTLLAREHFLRAEQLDGLAIDCVAQRYGPEDRPSLFLAARAQLDREAVEVLSIIGEVDLEHHVAAGHCAPVNGEAGLEGLRVEERVRGLRLPETGEDLGVQSVGVARLGADTVAQAFPVILGGRGDAIAVIAVANLVRRLELAEGYLHRGELRVATDARMKCCRDVVGATVDAFYVLKKANYLRDWVRERLVQLLREGGDLRANFGGNVPLDEVVDLIEAHEVAKLGIGEVDGRVDEELLCKLDDGTVRPADVPARAAVRAQAGDDLDDEVDLIREQRIEVTEALARQLWKPNLGSESGVFGKAATVLVIQLSECGLRSSVL